MKEAALKVYREAGASFAAVRVRRNRTLRAKAPGGRARLLAVAQKEGAIVDAAFNLFAEIAQRPPVSFRLLHAQEAVRGQ
jgi:hypothetical protein